MLSEPIPVALLHCANYDLPDLRQKVFAVLEASGIKPRFNERILVKPNLLQATNLACTNPQLTAQVCSWLLEHGAIVKIGDSPAFGAMNKVAASIGLLDALKPLGLGLTSFARSIPVRLPLPDAKKEIVTRVAAEALENDSIISVARLKAHSQMRLTLCVKNCFGFVPGLRKAIFHAFYGTTTEFFAACIAALYKILPPVAGFADGVVAMHVTGPSKGKPFALGLLGASPDAAALDDTIIQVLRIDRQHIPLAMAMEITADKKIILPLEIPADFNPEGFILPHTLKPATFSPIQLLKSLGKRVWKLLS